MASNLFWETVTNQEFLRITDYVEVYTYNDFKLYSSWSYIQCQFLYMIVVLKFKFLSQFSLLLTTELNHCNTTRDRRRLVTVYNYQRLKQQYLILLNGIVPKNGEQFLAFKRALDPLDCFYARVLEENEELEGCGKFLK